MKMKRRATKNAFTLIELLAVIVILAIIALIAVPVILNIINKANKAAFKDTAYGIISAGELYFAEQQLELNGMQGDVTIELPDTTKTLELKGNIPTGSIIITTDGKIALGIYNDRYCVTKGLEDKDITITEEFETCKPPIAEQNTGKTLSDIMNSTTNNCVKSGTCTPTEIAAGIKVNINVNNEKPYDFYVIKDDGKKITLMMDKNIGIQQAWASPSDFNCTPPGFPCSTNERGPMTILNYLNSQINTEDWNNITPIESYEYKNNPDEDNVEKEFGYQKLIITKGSGVLVNQNGTTETLSEQMRARLITEKEISTIVSSANGTTPEWLVYHLSDSNTIAEPYGYWFLTSVSTDSKNVRFMAFDGKIYNNLVFNDTDAGARPVIEIFK